MVILMAQEMDILMMKSPMRKKDMRTATVTVTVMLTKATTGRIGMRSTKKVEMQAKFSPKLL